VDGDRGTAARELAEALAAYARSQRDVLLRELAELCALDAPTGDSHALAATEEVLHGWLEALGAEVLRHPTRLGTHLEARVGPREGPALLLVAHYDTVWPRGTAAARPFRVEGGLAHGPGVFDMRAGLVATLGALRGLLTLGALDRPVVLLLNADEERGSETSARLVTGLGSESAVALVPEACLPAGRLKTARKGVVTYRLEIEGREAHAGTSPDRGISAVRELATLVHALDALARPELGTTVNVGVVGGGSRPNVVPGSAFAEVDVRVSTWAEYERIEGAVARLPVSDGARLSVERLHARPPMERTPAVALAAERARRIGALIGLELGEGTASGASDANLLAPLGIPVLDGLGPDGGGAHAVDEHVHVDSLVERTALLGLLVALV
jgi:glutamate carboxypeptidase